MPILRKYNVITMRQELTRIGNSRGIRIPKPVIEQCGLGNIVELRITSEGLVIAPHRTPREGWKEALAGSSPPEILLDPAPRNRFDDEEWKW
jgi:antitoxin MazE